MDALLRDPQIEIVVNLTTPPVHGPVCLRALEAGKHVYVEKPLSVSREDGQTIVRLARRKGLLAGGAPDTFLGSGIQTCRMLIDVGRIGRPVAATAFMTCHGHESWHPDPEFYYKAGGGPMFDMGPYYLTALVSLLGPVESVAGSARITFPTRTIMSEKKRGQIVEVEVPTPVAGLINFHSGAVGVIVTSFDIWDAHLPRIEIYGSEGSLSVPDPNCFGGPVLLKGKDDGGWTQIPLSHGYASNSRAWAWLTWPTRCGRAARRGPAQNWPIMCWTLCTVSTTPAGRALSIASRAVASDRWPWIPTNGYDALGIGGWTNHTCFPRAADAPGLVAVMWERRERPAFLFYTRFFAVFVRHGVKGFSLGYSIPAGRLKSMFSTPIMASAEKSAAPQWAKATPPWCGKCPAMSAWR